ncbi:MAG: sigma-70 family polymerase sigma factor [Segetibacter sp.]|nr:sigma-70 family polymerase sigma factor [Segetibacter sp.]
MKVQVSRNTKALEILTIRELIQAFKEPQFTTLTANDLRVEFHSRFKNGLYQQCLRLCNKNRLEEDVAKDLFQDVMIKALEKIETFALDPTFTEKRCINYVVAWLNRIALNSFLDFLKIRSKFCELDETDEEVPLDYSLLDSLEIEEYPNLQVTLQQAWDDLDDRERLIIYICLRYDCLDTKKHIPDEKIEWICKTLNIKGPHIRVIKLRALRKLRAAFN